MGRPLTRRLKMSLNAQNWPEGTELPPGEDG